MYCRGMLTVASDVEVLARFGPALADPVRARVLLALRGDKLSLAA